MAAILIIDDNETVREGVAVIARKMGHQPHLAKSGGEGLGLFRRHKPDFVITDLKMEGEDGIAVLRQIRSEDADAVVMIMTGYGTVEAAVEAMKLGAFDFIQKPFPPEVVRLKIEGALALRRARGEREKMAQTAETFSRDLAAPFASSGIVGSSTAMQDVMRVVEKVAKTDTTVYIHGESGTGKELVARAIHDQSLRREKPFVSVSCAALAETLLESELFGHEKGSFTGAIKRKLGRFELADGGTLFLDEIGDVPLAVQTKLLRVLQEREFERVGGEETVRVDVRVISATHRDITEMVKSKAFREDLFYRLHIVPIELPPVRDRPGDIKQLTEHFIKKLAPRTNRSVTGISDEALHALMSYRWPGNVREIENAIEQALVFADGPQIGRRDLPPFLGGATLPPPAHAPVVSLEDDNRTLDEILESLEKSLILRAFKRAAGVKTETARLLGIKTSALYYKLDKYGVSDADAQA